MSVRGGGTCCCPQSVICITYIHNHNYIIDSYFQFVTLHYGCKLSIHHSRMYVFLCTSVQRVLLQYWYYWCRSVQVHATLYIWMDVHGQQQYHRVVYVCMCVCTYVHMCVCTYLCIGEQILMSVLPLVVQGVTLHDPQCGIVQMRVFPWDGHLAVVVPDSRVNQSIATDCRTFWPRMQPCANCEQNCIHTRMYVCMYIRKYFCSVPVCTYMPCSGKGLHELFVNLLVQAEQYKIKQELASLAISLNMEAQKKRRAEVELRRDKDKLAARDIQVCV